MQKNNRRPTLTIGQLARRFGLNVRTLRYYEAIGLLPATARSEKGYRLYSEADVHRLRFVLEAKRMGLHLEEITQIVQSSRDEPACGYVRKTLSRHLTRLDDQIASLHSLRAEVSATLVAWYERHGAAEGQICGLAEPGFTRTSKAEQLTTGCPICERLVEMGLPMDCRCCKASDCR